MVFGFGNNVTATLAADITSLQTTLPVESGVGAVFAKTLTTDFKNSSVNHAVIAKITLCDREQTIWEICHLTAVNGDVLTVLRAQENTTARGWTSGTLIGNFATRGSENQFVQIGQLQAGDFVYAEALGTENNLVVNIPSTATSNNWDFKSPLVISPKSTNTGSVKIQLILGDVVIGTFPVYKGNKKSLARNDIIAGVNFLVLLDKTNTFFNLINAGNLYDLAQTAGQSGAIAISQKACDDNYAKKTSGDPLKVGRLNIESPTGDTIFNLGGTNGSGGSEFAYVRSTKRTQLFDTNTKTTVLFPQKSGELALTSDVDAINNYPVGAPIPWPQATAPAGYLICNGQPFDNVKYPKLALAYPSGILPKLFGEFIRGLDLEEKADPGRKILTNQGDAIRAITGRIGYARRGGSSPPVIAEGAFMQERTFSSNVKAGENDDWGSVISFNSGRVVPTANENRPRNVAFLYIVRAA